MRMIIHHIFLCFPACKPFYIASLFKLLWEKLHQISQTLNIVFQIEYYTKYEKNTNFTDLKVLTNDTNYSLTLKFQCIHFPIQIDNFKYEMVLIEMTL